MSTTKVALPAAAAVLYVTPASAQMSQDTPRLAFSDPIAARRPTKETVSPATSSTASHLCRYRAVASGDA